jgi:putative FmdB family regulatory protein
MGKPVARLAPHVLIFSCMPIYEYEHEGPGNGSCPGRFEAIEPMSKEPLTRCPTCGEPCRRVISTFGVKAGGRAGVLSRSNLEAHGFSQFSKRGKGYYEKTAGAGPKGIADGS